MGLGTDHCSNPIHRWKLVATPSEVCGYGLWLYIYIYIYKALLQSHDPEELCCNVCSNRLSFLVVFFLYINTFYSILRMYIYIMNLTWTRQQKRVEKIMYPPTNLKKIVAYLTELIEIFMHENLFLYI